MGPRGWQDGLWFGINEWVKWMNEAYQWGNDEMNEWMRNWTTKWMNVWKSEWMTDEFRSKISHVQMRFFWFVVCVVVQVRSVALCICWCNVCVHWAIEGAGGLAREREKMQQLREKKSSGCKLMKMKIPAASCNLFLLFLFFIFCHLDLCSSLRLIGLGNSSHSHFVSNFMFIVIFWSLAFFFRQVVFSGSLPAFFFFLFLF